MRRGCAVVAGASSGIGAATAIALASRDIDVVAAARQPGKLRDHHRFPEVAQRLHFFAADLTKPEEIDGVFSEAESAHGPVRYVLHSVGTDYRVGWYRDSASEDIFALVASLMASPALILSRALESMDSGGGNIGMVSSGAANRPTPGRALYSASKIAMNRLVQSVAAECEATAPATAVFAILPGRVDTPAQGRLMERAEDAHPAFGLERFKSKEGVFPADEVGTAIGSLMVQAAPELNGRIFRYSPEGWRSTEP